MKKAFSSFFGGKREKERDKAAEAAVEERLQAGVTGGEAAFSDTLARSQQVVKDSETKQQKQKEKHGKPHKQKTGSGKGRDGQLPAAQKQEEKQRKVSGHEDEMGEKQRKQMKQSGAESNRASLLQPESSSQSHANTSGSTAEDIEQPLQTHQQQPSPAEATAECQHLRQKITTLQSQIQELESALAAAGLPSSQTSPRPGADPRRDGPTGKTPEHPPSASQACQTDPSGSDGVEARSAEQVRAGRCPTCGHLAAAGGVEGEGGCAETAVQTEARDAAQCAACGAAMAAELALEGGETAEDSGEVGVSGADAEGRLQSDVKPDSELGKAASVPEPGDLSSEIARLASIQQQLQQSPPPLAKHPANLPPSPPAAPVSLASAEVQTECSHDQLTNELRELAERYDQLKRSCDALEEQRNELEEAENDARLMVQRQEVQILTAGEVERVLSSELAEEQERSSQLQRQLNSVRLKHQAALRARQADSASSGSQLVQELRAELEEMRTELEELRRTLELERGQRGTGGDRQRENVSVVVVDAGVGGVSATGSPEPRAVEGCASPLMAAAHTEKSSTFSDSGVGEDMSHASDVTAPSDAGVISPAPPSPHALPEAVEPTRSPGEARSDSRLSEEPVRCSQCSREMTGELGCLSTTASAGNSLLTITGPEQERYLAAALQLLETQQSGSGGPPGSGSSSTPKRDARSADASPPDESLTRQVALLQTELGAQLGTFEETRLALVRQHERQLQTLQGEHAQLQRQLAAAQQLQAELSAELELGAGGAGETGAEVSSALLRAVRETRQREQQLTAHCAELEKKEGAYRETLEEADRIMHSVEMRYQKNIEELENQLRESKNRINFMEGTEETLKQALYTASGKRDQQRVAELLDKLIETENEDLKLKDKVYRLERREREQSIKLREEQRAGEQLRLELRDQEELLRELDAARRQLAAAAEQPAALAALQQRCAELARGEQRLRGRVEELEQAEQALQEQLGAERQQAAGRERRLGEQVDCRQRELESLQAVLVEMQLQEVAGSEERAQLRRELQQAQRQQEQLQQLQQQQQRRRSQSDGDAGAAAAAERDEVVKLRSQLSQANLKITEKEELSSQLKEQLDKLQLSHSELQHLADCQRSRAEQDLLQLNLELSRREEEVAALSAQLRQVDSRQMARELDALAEQEGNLVKLLALVKATDERIKDCDSCRRAADGVLSAVTVSLEQVILLISGGSADQSLQAQLRDAEVLAAAAARLSAPPPGVSTGVQTAPPSADLQDALSLSQQQLALSREELELRTEELEARGCELRLLREQLAQQQRQLRRRLAQQAAQAGAAAETKDRLLGALLRRLRRVLTAQQAARLAAELREVGEGEGDRQSFDLDVVCQVLQQNSRTEQIRGKTPPVEKPPERSLESSESLATSKSSSRIPRLFNKTTEANQSETPPARKRTPPSKVPLPRRALPTRASGPPVLPPVGVARPYRSASSPGLSPAPAAPSPQREWSPAPALGGEASPARRECSPGREWSEESPDGLLPPPDGFQIVRPVGGDSLLLYWSPVEDPRITGYQIFVDSQLQLSIRNPQRTKALLPALDLSSPLRLGIRAVAPGETYSAFSCADHRPGKMAAAA